MGEVPLYQTRSTQQTIKGFIGRFWARIGQDIRRNDPMILCSYGLPTAGVFTCGDSRNHVAVSCVWMCDAENLH